MDGICRPVKSFSQVARQVGMKDEDGLRFAVLSGPRLLAVPPPGPTAALGDCEHSMRVHRSLEETASDMETMEAE